MEVYYSLNLLKGKKDKRKNISKLGQDMDHACFPLLHLHAEVYCFCRRFRIYSFEKYDDDVEEDYAPL